MIIWTSSPNITDLFTHVGETDDVPDTRTGRCLQRLGLGVGLQRWQGQELAEMGNRKSRGGQWEGERGERW